jgi:hypothetical protein
MIQWENLWMVDIGLKHETLAESKAKQSKARPRKFIRRPSGKDPI